MEKRVEKSVLFGALVLASLGALAPLISGCAPADEPAEGKYQKKGGGSGNADLALPGAPDLGGLDFASAGPADFANTPYDFAFGGGPSTPPADMAKPVCTSNCWTIYALDGEVPAFKPNGNDWDSGATDYPDPFVRVTLSNGVSGQVARIDNTYFPSWNGVVLQHVPFDQLGKNISFEFMDHDGFLNPDDTIVKFTTTFDANDIASGGFTWNITDGYVTLGVMKE